MAPSENESAPELREREFLVERLAPLRPKGSGHALPSPAPADNPADDEDSPPVDPEQPEAPQPPPANNWEPIGPSVLRQGRGGVRPAIRGRTPAVAVAPGGSRVYIGAANGGVWRSDNAG